MKLSEYKDIDALDEKTFTKRIIALEGETVEIEARNLLISDQLVKDDFSINGFAGKDMEKLEFLKIIIFLLETI